MMVVFSSSALILLSKCCSWAFFKRHSQHISYKEPLKLFSDNICYLYLLNREDMCFLCFPSALLNIDFLCEQAEDLVAERRHFLGAEYHQCSIFSTCCCSIFNALHSSCSRKEWQWKAKFLSYHDHHVEICFVKAWSHTNKAANLYRQIYRIPLY